VPCLMLIASQESSKYFSKMWACLVGSISILPVSESFTAWRLARGCALLIVTFRRFLSCFINQLLLLFTSNFVVFFVV